MLVEIIETAVPGQRWQFNPAVFFPQNFSGQDNKDDGVIPMDLLYVQEQEKIENKETVQKDHE